MESCPQHALRLSGCEQSLHRGERTGVSAEPGGNKDEARTPAGAEVKPEVSHREGWELAERVWGSASGAM